MSTVPAVMDHYALFGLPERFAVDLADLERRYLALSRELHPDRHATGTPQARLQAVQRTTDLNEAYRVLKDEFRRAEHLLRRRGVETSEQNARDNRATVDAALLMEIMELREALAEARERHDRARIDRLAADVDGRSQAAWTSLRGGFAELEAGQGSTARVAKELTSLRYYRRILDELAEVE